MSRSLFKAILSVRGIGVAVIVKISTCLRKAFSFSFCFTPKRCSSSIITKPKSLNLISGCSSRCVPITIWTLPSASPSRIFFCCAGVLNLESISQLMSKPSNLLEKLLKCWSVRIVIGEISATCLPASAALKAARIATSVFPKPTSPQINRSIGFRAAMSLLTSWIARNCPGVSS